MASARAAASAKAAAYTEAAEAEAKAAAVRAAALAGPSVGQWENSEAPRPRAVAKAVAERQEKVLKLMSKLERGVQRGAPPMPRVDEVLRMPDLVRSGAAPMNFLDGLDLDELLFGP